MKPKEKRHTRDNAEADSDKDDDVNLCRIKL